MVKNICAVMIVKNEEAILTRCLEALRKFGLEIVIIDTGSTDKTKEIALKYTSKVYDYKWENDFSKARNFSLSKVECEYALIIDADEIVTKFEMNKLEELIENNSEAVGRIIRINEYERNGEKFYYSEKVNRLFRKKLYRYEGRIHEQVVRKDGNPKYSTYNIPIELRHCGYEAEEINRKNKINRNIELLKKMLDEESNPYILYQLGKSYYMNQNYIEAEKYFCEALEFDLDVKLEYVKDMIETYGYTLLNNQKYEKALELEGVYSEFSGSADFVFLMANIYMNNGYYDAAILEFEKAKKYNDCKMQGVNDYYANYNIGVIYECLGDIKNAIKYYEKSQKYEKSKKRLNLMTKKL